MAFINKIGNILKQTASKRINLELSASNPSIYQAIRCMSSSKIFIGGLSFSTDEVSLRETFAAYGEVVEARVIMDRETGRSRGFGFVSYASNEDASSAIQAMDGKDLHGRSVRVNYATDRAGGYRSGGFGGGDGGGYGGGNGSYGGGGGGYGDSGSGSYGGGAGGHSGGGGGYGGNYGSGGGGDSYGSGTFGGGSSFGGGNSAGYDGGGNSGNYSVAGGVGGSNNHFNGGSGGDSGFASSGYSGTIGTTYGGDGQLRGNESSITGGGDGGYGQDAFKGNYRDDDVPGDYANTRG